MASYFKRLDLSLRQRPAEQTPDFQSPSYENTESKTSKSNVYDYNGKSTPGEEPEADKIIAPGELSFEEGTSGGLGRHLGLFSTTLLM
jgi:hypothetical protein